MNKADHEGFTPLVKAVSTGRLNIVRTLLKAGASITIATLAKAQPIYLAGESQNTSPEIVKALFEFDANPNACRPNFATLLPNAANQGSLQIARALLSTVALK